MRFRSSFILVYYFIVFLKTSDANYKEKLPNVDEDDLIVFKKYVELDNQIKEMINFGIKRTFPMLIEASDRLNLTAKCMGNIFQLTTAIRKLKISALTFLDASGKPSAGFFDGNMHMLGDYDQCLAAVMEKRKGEISFKGQYCLINYRPLLTSKKRPVTFDSGVEELVEATKNTSEVVRFFVSKAHLFYLNPGKFGACFPSGCTEDDVSQIVKYVGDKIYINATLAYCDDDTDNFFTERNISFMTCFVIIGVLAVTGTFIEYYSWKNIKILKSTLAKLLLCFSIIRNFPKAISTSQPDNNISCLNGIRALTLLYLILLHQYYAVVKYYITSHAIRALDEIPQFFFQIIANGFLTADVYFFMGGLLNCYTRVNLKKSKTRRTHFFFLYIHRIIRIGPPYLFFSFLMSLFRPYGPMRLFEKNNYVEKCNKYWWQNTLFINNFFFQDDTCSPHTWYLAADMQLFILSLFTIPVFFKCSKKGIVVNCAVIVCGILFTVIWSWVNKLTPGVVFYRPNEDELNSAWNAHTSTFPHVAPYFTGILMGYLLATKPNLKISKMYQLIGWPVAALLFTSMLFMTKVWNSGGAFTAVDSSFYFGFSKFLFVVGISWMVLCCTTGNGGVINYILSLPLWVPISRISYVVFLIAPFLQTFYFANSRNVVDGHRMPLIWRYAGDTMISCVLGLVIYVLIEAPFVNIEKFFLYRTPALNEETIKPEDIIKNKTLEEKENNKNEKELNNKNIADHSCQKADL